MSVHVQTGNQIDVVYTYKDGKQILLGIQPWFLENPIPVPDPEGLISVLRKIVAECQENV